MNTSTDRSVDASVREIWHILHAMPETAWHEERTARYLADELAKAGFTVEHVAKTGVIGTLVGKEPGPTVAFRADSDALPCNGGAAHLCGHDANSAMVLELARRAAASGIGRGTLKVVFQPAEEVLTGAKTLLAEGALDAVDTLVGVHLRPIHEARLGQAMGALHHSASYVVDVAFKGTPAHAARPHLGCNAVDAAALAIMNCNAIRLDPNVSHSIKATQIHADAGATNIIPDQCAVVFDVRAGTNGVMEELLAKLRAAVQGAADCLGAECSFAVRRGSPAGDFDAHTVSLLERAIVETLGSDGLIAPVHTAGGDDFHFYRHEKPEIRTAFLGLGADLVPGLHHPDMHFDLSALAHGVEILERFLHHATAPSAG